MLALLRLVIFGFIILTVIYVSISLYSRSVRRRKLLKDWQDTGRPGDKDAYIETGMAQYQHSLRRRLIWLVYIVPITMIAAIIYFTNFM
ncbi:hypothetical protein SAMN05444414_108109 [Roseovarius marisflavi]|mgnify:CR=1 FL=1|uniref:Cation/multidrug efflux pump n=1 Tax=Roseovarius marisflavi TaxID=1054996 RepID=A0A1M6Z0S1_9RHOB|nr:hypothetical protein [Roseovarius marisflavi]SHL23980.1 hypothetical protein SAMN05444414_108109 [Roseovarius marisflavi]